MSKAAHIDIDYDKLHYELEKRARAVFCENNKYGYKLSVQNTVLGKIYEAFIMHNKIMRPPSDRERFLWETAVSVYLCKMYKNMYKTDLYYPVVAWQLDRLEECVRCINVSEAITAVLKLCEHKNVIKRAEETYLKYRKDYTKDELSRISAT